MDQCFLQWSLTPTEHRDSVGDSIFSLQCGILYRKLECQIIFYRVYFTCPSLGATLLIIYYALNYRYKSYHRSCYLFCQQVSLVFILSHRQKCPNTSVHKSSHLSIICFKISSRDQYNLRNIWSLNTTNENILIVSKKIIPYRNKIILKLLTVLVLIIEILHLFYK